MAVLVNKPAPDFIAKAVVRNQFTTIRLSDFKGHKYVVLFFYPLDFTFVCPTELHAFQEKLADFHQRGCEILGASIDSEYCHHAWLATPREKGGISGIEYPLIADCTKQIARDYDVLLENQGIALRGLFLIDKQGLVQHQMVNNLPLGRNVDEVLRVLDALQFTEKHGEVCPANWTQGRKALKPDTKGLHEYFAGQPQTAGV